MMTQTSGGSQRDDTSNLHEATGPEAIRALIHEIAPGAARRDLDRELPEADLRRLLAAGLGALRVPLEDGGHAASITDLTAILIELAAADSNLVQIVRGHLGFIELLRLWPRTPASTALLRAAGRGALFGPAASEKSRPGGPPTALLDLRTRLERDDAGLWLSGEKYYTTGSLFADWINVLVPFEDGFAEVVVARDAPGVRVIDDWAGFGQRLTASGTTVFDRVAVRDDYVFAHADPDARRYVQAFYQFVHVATQAGIARRISADLVSVVRARNRAYPLASTIEPSRDPQVLTVVGDVESRAFSARASALLLARDLDRYADPVTRGQHPAALETAVISAAGAQISATRLVGEAAWLLFDAGGASTLNVPLGMDRHWRNARTVSSHNPVIYKASQIGNYLVNDILVDSLSKT